MKIIMKKSILLNEDERSRILNLHETAKNLYENKKPVSSIKEDKSKKENMKKVIKLTESDLEKIVRRVIEEQYMGVAFGGEQNGLQIKKMETKEQTAPQKPNQFCPKLVPSPGPTDWNKVKAEIGKYGANKSGESVYIPSYPTTFFVSNNTGTLGNVESPEERTTGGNWLVYQIKNTWGPNKLFCVPKIKQIGTLYISSTGAQFEASPVETPSPMEISLQDAQFTQMRIDPKQIAQGMKAFINTNPTYKEIINNPQFANSIGKTLKQYVNV
jgi:hypothetical protein